MKQPKKSKRTVGKKIDSINKTSGSRPISNYKYYQMKVDSIMEQKAKTKAYNESLKKNKK